MARQEGVDRLHPLDLCVLRKLGPVEYLLPVTVFFLISTRAPALVPVLNGKTKPPIKSLAPVSSVVSGEDGLVPKTHALSTS